MPLKHFTETLLVVLLAVVTIATAVIVSVLPPIPEGFFTWSVLFALTIVYPALLYPLLKSNRADYSFRALHFAPVAIVLIWMFIQIALMKEPRVAMLYRVYTWGFGLLPIVVTFGLLALFCLEVIRRRVPRLTFLTLLLVPFAAVAISSEQWMHWDAQLAALINRKPLEIAMNGSSSSLSATSRGEKNLSSSSDAGEEEWRKKLRSVEGGKVHSSVSVGSTLDGVDAAAGLAGSKSSGTKHVVKRPPTRLPKSGGEMEALALLFVAATAAAAHSRAQKRAL